MDDCRYEISTLRDVFDKVPANRILDCLTELAAGMERAKHMHELSVETTGGAIGIAWPETVTWVDDGAGHIELHYHGDASGVYIERTTLNPPR